MKARPILFSSDMVRALLDGRKTQTRRVMKVQPSCDGMQVATCVASTDKARVNKYHWVKMAGNGYSYEHKDDEYFKCPFGKTGELLWVRETFCLEGSESYEPVPLIPHYRASLEDLNEGQPLNDDRIRWKPSIFMPKWASRITLEITNVRVERLQDISREDALAEGCAHPLEGMEMASYIMQNADYVADEKTSFARLWQSINGVDSWEANPWVWVLEFKVHHKNVLEMIDE